MTESLSPAGLDRLHAAIAARVERQELPGKLILIARGDDVHVDAIGVKVWGGKTSPQLMTCPVSWADVPVSQLPRRPRHF